MEQEYQPVTGGHGAEVRDWLRSEQRKTGMYLEIARQVKMPLQSMQGAALTFIRPAADGSANEVHVGLMFGFWRLSECPEGMCYTRFWDYAGTSETTFLLVLAALHGWEQDRAAEPGNWTSTWDGRGDAEARFR